VTMDISKYNKFPSVAVLDCVQNQYNVGIQSGAVALCLRVHYISCQCHSTVAPYSAFLLAV